MADCPPVRLAAEPLLLSLGLLPIPSAAPMASPFFFALRSGLRPASTRRPTKNQKEWARLIWINVGPVELGHYHSREIGGSARSLLSWTPPHTLGGAAGAAIFLSIQPDGRSAGGHKKSHSLIWINVRNGVLPHSSPREIDGLARFLLFWTPPHTLGGACGAATFFLSVGGG